MHTYKGNSCTIIYNSDLSGDIFITNQNGELQVNGNDILDFIAEFVRTEKISVLESATSKEVLGINRR